MTGTASEIITAAVDELPVFTITVNPPGESFHAWAEDATAQTFVLRGHNRGCAEQRARRIMAEAFATDPESVDVEYGPWHTFQGQPNWPSDQNGHAWQDLRADQSHLCGPDCDRTPHYDYYLSIYIGGKRFQLNPEFSSSEYNIAALAAYAHSSDERVSRKLLAALLEDAPALAAADVFIRRGNNDRPISSVSIYGVLAEAAVLTVDALRLSSLPPEAFVSAGALREAAFRRLAFMSGNADGSRP